MLTQDGSFRTAGATSTSAAQSSTGARCDGVPIWWQASDVAVLSSASHILFSPGLSTTTGPTATSNTAPQFTTTSLPIPSASPLSDSNSHGLSTSAEIAIGICIPLTLLAVSAVLLAYFKKRHSQLKNIQNPGVTQHHLAREVKKVEAANSEIYELQGQQVPAVDGHWKGDDQIQLDTPQSLTS
jgi:H+/gluconate symporter-like permease